MVKKVVVVLMGVIAFAVLGFFGYLEYFSRVNYAAPTDLALDLLQEEEGILVSEEGDWLTLRPVEATPTVGLILYPGANCDIRGYSPVLSKIAAAGYLVVAISMPYDFAILSPGRADQVIQTHPSVRDWVLVGHSMGGAAAAQYAVNNPDKLAGLILWDSYPPGTHSLVGSTLPVTSIHRATMSGSPPQKFVANAHLLPESTRWVPIPGGIHMYFGSFSGGGYEEEWEPAISASEQHGMVVEATVTALRDAAG